MKNKSFPHHITIVQVLILILSLPLTTPLDKSPQCINNNQCRNQYHCNTNTSTCIHNSIFPLHLTEIISFPLLALSYGISNLCGIGGGGTATSILLWTENFSTSEAIPISMAVMFISSTYTFYLGIKFKKLHPKIDFADYKFAGVIIPFILFGSKIGSILNFILPFLIPSCLLVVLIIQASRSIKRKYDFLLEKENLIDFDIKLLKTNENIEDGEKIRQKERSFSKIENFFSVGKDNETSNDKVNDDNYEKFQKMMSDDQDPFPKKWRNSLFFTFLIYFLDVSIEGSSGFKSIIGIELCSLSYWLIFSLSGVVFYFISLKNREIINKDYNEKKRLNKDYSNKLEEIIIQTDDGSHHKLLFYSFSTGVISGCLGIGGGMILTPYMITLGYSPKQATSTINLIIIFISASSTLMFAMIGSLYINYVILLGVPTLIACYFSSHYINNYIKNTGKQSFLLLFLLIISLVSFLLLIWSMMMKIDYIQRNDLSLFSFNYYCSGS